MARILGINYTQDASIAIIDTTRKHFFAIRKERLDKIKHSWGAVGDFKKYYSALQEVTEYPFDLIVESYSSDPIREKMSQLRSDILECIKVKSENVPVLEISHHLAHLFSVIPYLNNKKALAFVADFMGSSRRLADRAPVKAGEGIDRLFEVATMYDIDSTGAYTVIGKQLWDNTIPQGLGGFYQLMTKCIFRQPGSEGKVMGLASYGIPGAIDLPDLIIEDGCKVLIPCEWYALFESTGCYNFSIEGIWDSCLIKDAYIPNLKVNSSEFQYYADIAYAGQKAFEQALLKVFKWGIEKTGHKEILFSGGIALNCVANYAVSRELPGCKITVPAWPDDGGTSIGAACWGAYYLDEYKKLPPCSLNYTGIDIGKQQISFAEEPVSPPGPAKKEKVYIKEYISEEDPLLFSDVAALLAEGYVIGICQGKSEFGPRALGNRSLLADCRRIGVRDFINFRIKGREWFRPVAPIILDSHKDTFFEFDYDSPFMEFAVNVNQDKQHLIPGVVHIDSTARMQTLKKQDNPVIAGIIEKMYEFTKIPIVINTSLNPKGEVIIESKEEALNMLHTTHMFGLVYNATFYYKEKSLALKVEDNFIKVEKNNHNTNTN